MVFLHVCSEYLAVASQRHPNTRHPSRGVTRGFRFRVQVSRQSRPNRRLRATGCQSSLAAAPSRNTLNFPGHQERWDADWTPRTAGTHARPWVRWIPRRTLRAGGPCGYVSSKLPGPIEMSQNRGRFAGPNLPLLILGPPLLGPRAAAAVLFFY